MKRFLSSGLLRVSSIFVGLLVAAVFFTGSAHAANISVNSNADTAADDGVCTLREAITAANNDAASGLNPGECGAGAGTDTISFAITGLADYTVSGQSGYTIAPLSVLPAITQTVTIDGYTQSGSQANTAPSPEPFNGILLIEIDGQSAGFTAGSGTAALNFSAGSQSSTVRGLVINNFGLGETATGTADPSAILVGASAITIRGNYFGTDPTGMVRQQNLGCGVCMSANNSDDIIIGGLTPADRNIISGNKQVGISPNTDSDNWLIQGNYIGAAADGLTSIGNGDLAWAGGISLDNSVGHMVGGPDPAARNILSGNDSQGIAPDFTDNSTIEGNYVGVGYDGVTPLPNAGVGIGVGNTSQNIILRNNIVAHNLVGGIALTSAATGTKLYGNTVEANDENGGISVFGAINKQIGGGATGEGNIIRGNIRGGISVLAFNGLGVTTTNTTIQGNLIEDTQQDVLGIAPGVIVMNDATNTLIGGSGPGEGNTIRGNYVAGVAVQELSSSVLSVTVTPTNVAILGNSISGTIPAGGLFGSNSLGIDILSATDTTGPAPDGFPESYSDLGPNLNDATDPDTGPNNYMNFPIINDATQNGTNLAVNFDLDAADSPVDQYRVEFFANDTADTAGYAEGQAYRGSTIVTNGAGQLASLTLPANTDLTGRVLSATTTAIDAATPSDFGATSEFSQVRSITVLPQAALAETGDNALVYLLGLGTMLVVGVGLRRRATRH